MQESKKKARLNIQRLLLSSIVTCALLVGVFMVVDVDRMRISPRIFSELPMKPEMHMEIVTNEHYLFADMHAAKYGGGVGNFMFEFMALIGMAHKMNRTPAIDPGNNLAEICLGRRKAFKNLMERVVIRKPFNATNVDIPYVGCCKMIDIHKIFDDHENETEISTRLVYSQSFKYFDTLKREEILHLLEFVDKDVELAKTNMTTKEAVEGTHNICVHIRRGDYLKSTLHEASGEGFSRAAIYYVVEQVRRLGTGRPVSVLMLGNDLDWERTLFAEMKIDFPFHTVLQNKDWAPNIDWVFSSVHCDTVILTASASTYGWWLAYVSRGQDIYYNEKFSKPDGIEKELDPSTFYPPSWKKLRYDGPEKKVTLV